MEAQDRDVALNIESAGRIMREAAAERLRVGEKEWKRRCDAARREEMRAFLEKYGSIPEVRR